jgi:acyl-coenzyme A thioesterase PaaI-like protein
MPLISKFLPSIEEQGNLIRSMWDRLHDRPGGKTVFSRLLGTMAPYTGTIRPRIEELRMGHARVTMRDRRGVRNHLNSIHAVALFNLAEATGNLALGYSLPDDARFIPVRISIEYLKKARGTLTGVADCEVPTSSETREVEIPVSIRNTDGEEVARAMLMTRVGPKKH